MRIQASEEVQGERATTGCGRERQQVTSPSPYTGAGLVRSEEAADGEGVGAAGLALVIPGDHPPLPLVVQGFPRRQDGRCQRGEDRR